MKPTELRVNRREWLGGLLALATPIGLSAGQEKEAAGEFALGNANLDFRFVASKGKVISRRLWNKIAD